MNMFTIIILAICAALYYIDFLHMLKNKTYRFKKDKNGKAIPAGKIDAWLSFAVATIALFILVSNFFAMPDIVLNVSIGVFLLVLIGTRFRGK